MKELIKTIIPILLTMLVVLMWGLFYMSAIQCSDMVVQYAALYLLLKTIDTWVSFLIGFIKS